MATIRIGEMFARIVEELDRARNSLSEAASWARSDWSDNRSLTGRESDARLAVFTAVQDAKDAIDRAKGRISWIERDRGHDRG